MSVCFVTGEWVDGETGALSDKGGGLVKALQIEYPGLKVKALGWDTEAELEAADVIATVRSKGVARDKSILVVGGGMGTFRVTFATSTNMRFACVAAGFRYGTDTERAKTIEAVLEENIPDLVVLTSGAFLNFKPESIPEGAHLSSMNAYSWCERLPGDFVKHTFPIIDPSLIPSFLPWNLVGAPLVGLRSYVHNGQLKKVTWARGVPAMEPTFLTPHRKIIDRSDLPP